MTTTPTQEAASMPEATDEAADTATQNALQAKFRQCMTEMKDEIIGHDDAVDGAWLAALAMVPAMFIGAPGIGKSAICDGVLDRMPDFRQYRATLNEFFTIDEVFGPVSFAQLKQDNYQRQTDGYLPWAEAAFLDEFPRTTGPVAGNLLNLFNEGHYFDGQKRQQSDLAFTLLAANFLPDEDEAWGAVLDRLVLRYDVHRIPADDHSTRYRILSGNIRKNLNPTLLTKAEVEQARLEVEAMPVSSEFLDNFLCQELVPKLCELADSTFAACSDRRLHRGIAVAKAFAWLSGAAEVKREHGVVYSHIIWNLPHEYETVRELVLDKCGATSITIDGNTLPEELSEIVDLHAQAMEAALKLNGVQITTEIADSTTAATKKLKDVENDWSRTTRNLPDKEKRLAKVKDALARINEQMQSAMKAYTDTLS